ncbi:MULTISPECIES: peptidoglycan-binding protein [unclassified Streptomyces]|uniref:peptidoglycan-binding protein n=1 Tax=unclassified Streptomyces TaxID=2593676 RepID=UPI001F04DB3F|nr:MULTISPECIES: peptidoglycan-binding protein [unclassified Streptomyces]MCH0563761.1 peptidoglycan-binding protein [Streptomyces sp. MUM 2J]MCH0573485.1 peptidoglycan-binding protein [Streptomyces sp. MUM 136J]
METPVFEEVDPESDCDCPGCVQRRRTLRSSPAGRAPAHRAALIVAAATSGALAAAHAAPAAAVPHGAGLPGLPAGDEPDTPQGSTAPLHGPSGGTDAPAESVKLPATTRAEIIRRAKVWVAAQVPYSMTRYWSDGYRQDCSGFVSMAWNLPGNEWTGSLAQYADRISRDELEPGDILLFHNPANPTKGSHVVIFGGWTDYTHSYYIAYEQTSPTTRRQATPYPYWSNASQYVPYRYKSVTAGTAGGEAAEPEGPTVPEGQTPFPGVASFRLGANNEYVTLLGRMLVARGAGRFYSSGPGPRWTESDRRAVEAFQRAQGWKGAEADGYPGPHTWSLLVTGKGRSVPAAAAQQPAAGKPGALPPFPGRGLFRLGANNAYVTQLGRQLVAKGYGTHYTKGPGPRWSEADRRNVEAFQRAQGWRGTEADGYPGPETWRRLFS